MDSDNNIKSKNIMTSTNEDGGDFPLAAEKEESLRIMETVASAESTALAATNGDASPNEKSDKKKDDHNDEDKDKAASDEKPTSVPPGSSSIVLPLSNDAFMDNAEKKIKTATKNNDNTSAKNQVSKFAMDLNVAYEALEQVRQANVAIEFGRQILHKECIPCLRDKIQSQQNAAKMSQTESRFKKFMAANKPANVRPAAPCLTCGNQVCPRHRCQALKKENINICNDCSIFFSLDSYLARVNLISSNTTGDNHLVVEDGDIPTINNNINNNTTTTNAQVLSYLERKQQMNHMLDVYDRALLVLQYSSRYINDIAMALENNTKRNNQIGFGSSATGFVSGIAGVAAACTIFTPVGPPLLIASILFGGGATAASAGSEAVNYHCSANKMCDTIIALHGMLHSISRFTVTPTADVAGNDDVVDNESNSDGGTNDSNHSERQSGRQQQQQSHNSSNNSTRSASPMRKDAKGNTNKEAVARNWTRAAGNALKPLTGGALSAVSVVTEAREMRVTLEKINAGNPCAKAESLREIGIEVQSLPSTTVVADACPKFFNL